jgi:hypothetical protein
MVWRRRGKVADGDARLEGVEEGVSFCPKENFLIVVFAPE